MATPAFWLQVAGAGLQGVLGAGQLVGGMLMDPKRPTYQIPREISDMLALRQMNLRGRMAGASQAQANIQQAQGSTIGAYQGTLRNPNAILAGVAASQGQTNRAFQNLASMEAQDYQRRLAGLEGAQRTMAGYRDRSFEINEMQPFLDEARTKAALIGGGLRNISGAVSGVAGAAGEAEYMKMMRDIYGAGATSERNPFMGMSADFNPPPVPPVEMGMIANQSTVDTATGGTASNFGVGALASNLAFNDWLRRTTGKNATEFTNAELAFFRSQYMGR